MQNVALLILLGDFLGGGFNRTYSAALRQTELYLLRQLWHFQSSSSFSGDSLSLSAG